MYAVLLRNDPRGEGRVGDQQYERRRRIHAAHLAHDPIGSDDRHALLNAAIFPAIHHNRLGPLIRGVPDDVRGNGLRRGLGLENRERVGPIGGGELGSQELVIHLDAIDLVFQPLVFFAHIQKHEVIAEKSEALLRPDFDGARQRRYAPKGQKTLYFEDAPTGGSPSPAATLTACRPPPIRT